MIGGRISSIRCKFHGVDEVLLQARYLPVTLPICTYGLCMNHQDGRKREREGEREREREAGWRK